MLVFISQQREGESCSTLVGWEGGTSTLGARVATSTLHHSSALESLNHRISQNKKSL